MSQPQFSDLVRLSPQGEDSYGAHIDPTFTIGPKVHGGSLMAVVASAARTHARRHAGREVLQPLVVSSSFLTAPDPGDVTVRVQILKSGRTATTAAVQIEQNDRTAVHSVVTLGHLSEAAPEVNTTGAAGTLALAPDGPQVTGDHPVAAVNHVSAATRLWLAADTAMLRGETGAPSFNWWFDFQAAEAAAADADLRVLFLHLATDISAPVPYNLGKYGWAPTVQLTSTALRVPAPGPLRIHTEALSLSTPWFSEDHTIVDSLGNLVAQSRQMALTPLPPR